MISNTDLENESKFIIQKLKNSFEYGKFRYSETFLNDPQENYSYNLPDIETPKNIILSNDPCTYSNIDKIDNIFDVLGIYRKSKEHDQEGEIVLFLNCIEKYAEEFYQNKINSNKLNWSLEEYTKAIAKVVLWHELGHWITHWLSDPDGGRWGDPYWNNRSPDFEMLGEGLAQLFTYFSILCIQDFKESAQYLFLFQSLVLGQSEPYHSYKLLLKESNFSWSKLMEILPLIRKQDTPQKLDNLIYHLRKTK